METLTALLTVTLPIIGTLVPTIVLTNRQTQCLIRKLNLQTQRIIENSNRQTLKLLREIREIQESIKETQKDIRRCLVKLERLQRDTYCLLRKLHVGMRANALMHGWACAEGLTPEQIRRLPEPKVYDLELGVCYYRAG